MLLKRNKRPGFLGLGLGLGLGRNATLIYDPVHVPGAEFYIADNSTKVSNSAAAFSGSSQYFSAPINASNAIGNFDFWFAGWVYCTDNTANRTLFSNLVTSTLKGTGSFSTRPRMSFPSAGSRLGDDG